MKTNASPTSTPIAVLDGGLGGLTVASAIQTALPREDVLYFGDTARGPYSSKSSTVIVSFLRQMIAYLLPWEPKHFVIACNTATAIALGPLKKLYPELSISGVIDPATKAGVVAAGSKHFPVMGVLGTDSRFVCAAYERSIARRRNHARLFGKPTPLLLPLIEEGRDPDDQLLKLVLRQSLTQFIDRGLDVLVLGCPYLALLKESIATIVGKRVQIIDSSEQCAQDVSRRLLAAGLLSGELMSGGRLHCFVTDISPALETLASRFFKAVVPKPHSISPDDLHQLGSGIAGFSPVPGNLT